MKVSLRPYQQKLVDDLRAAFQAGSKAPLVVSPTGSGKTFTYSVIANGAGEKGNRVLILEHRKELLRQASSALAALGVIHRVIAPQSKISDIRRVHVSRFGKPFINDGAHVAVASVQTLIRRLAWLQEFDPDLIIIDEGDLAIAGSWEKIIAAVPRARLAGFTASPCRTDGIGMDKVYDTLVPGPTMADLVDMGNLCRPRVFAPPLKYDIDSVGRRGGDLDAQQLADVIDKPSVTGDAVDHYKELAPGKPAIVFCASVKHARHVAAQFQEAGFRFEVVTGCMDDDSRDDRIFGLADGKYHGIVTVDVVSRGTDIPVAEVAILLRPTESLALYLQQVGRVLRPADGKEYGLVLDHAGNTLRHGLPHSDREWTLKGREKRKGKQGDEAPELKILQCPACYVVHDPQPTCPQCGHVYEAKVFQPRHVDGQLEEVQETEEERERREARKAQGKAQSVDDMVKKLGYSRGRAEKIIEARQEKERLQTELRDLGVRFSKRTGQSPLQAFGFAMSDIRTMKPKQLKENIEKVSEALFMQGANDNEPPQQRRLIGG